MYTKKALKNLKNRYKAVLNKCRLLNAFGSLAIIASLLCGSAFAGTPNLTITTQEYVDANASTYYTTYEMPYYDRETETYLSKTYGILVGLEEEDGYSEDIGTLLVNAITGTTSDISSTETTYFKNITQVTTETPEANSYTFSIEYGNTIYYFAVYDDSNALITEANNTREEELRSNVNDNFIGISTTTDTNYPYVGGGAIRNISESNLTIAGIFIDNNVKTNTTYNKGGAIYNSGKISSISGSFFGNYATSTASDPDTGSSAYGGAIANDGSIGNISASFIGNYVESDTTFNRGGAIYNSGTITSILGSFFGNYATSTASSTEDISSSAIAGAIYNSGTIDFISGLFFGNYATTIASDSGSAGGGAISNIGTISSISASFIGNWASGTSAYGGAIYNFARSTSANGQTYPAKLTFLANAETHIFTDNYTLSGTDKDYNFITSDGGSLTFTMQGTGGFILNDSILKSTLDNNSSAYTLAISGESKENNIFSLNDEISGFSTFTVSDATLSLGSYNHGDLTTVASFGGESGSIMTFTNANLSIDTLAFTGITSGTAAITGTNITLNVDADSTLILTNASANTYTIAENFVTGSTWFTEDTTTVTNSLLEVTAVSGDAMTEAYTVTVGVKAIPETDTENSIYNTPSAGLINTVASSDFYSSNSINAGARFIYSTMESSATDAQKIQIVEGAVQMGAVAGVQKQLATSTSTSNTVLETRMLNANSINPNATSMRVVDEKGQVLVYNNVSSLASNDNNNYLSTPKNYTELWFMPMYSHDNVSNISSGNFSDTGYQSDMYGVALGIDRTFQDKYRIGLAFDLGSGSSESTGDYAKTTNDSDFFGFTAYGSLAFENFSILGSVGYTNNSSEVLQDLSAYSLSNLYSDIRSDVWNFALKAQYNHSFGNGFTLSPYVGVQYMIMSTNDYKVKDSNSIGSGTYGDTIFNVTSDRQDIVSFPLGVSLSKEIHTESGWDFTPKVNAGVIFATGDLHATTVSSIPGIDASSKMSLKTIDDTTLDFGLGFSASKDNLTMLLDYDFQYSQHRTANGVQAKVLFKF